MPEAIPELVWFALLFFLFAFVWCTRKLIAAMFKPIFSIANIIPLVGPSLDSFLHSIEQGVDSALGDIEHGIDGLIGSSFHRMAELMSWTWRELKRHSTLFALMAPAIAETTWAIEHIRSLVHRAEHFIESIPHDIRRLDREFNGIEHRVKTLERDLTKGIGHDLRLSVHELDKELTHLEHRVIPSLRAAEHEADREIGHLYDWLRGKASILGVGTLAGVVAAVLATIGNGWLGCKENPFARSKNPCGLWNILGNVLGLAAFLTLAFDFQEFVDASDEVAGFIGKSVQAFEGSFPISLPPLPPPV